MNDQQFLERAHANPHDDSPDFLEAVAGNTQRQALVEELKTLDSRLKAGLDSVPVPPHLKQALLDIPASMGGMEGMESAEHTLHPGTGAAAANDSFWRRNVKYAAGVIIAIGVLVVVMQNRVNPLEDMVFRHIYSELSLLEDDSPMGLDQVNLVMNSSIGSAFSDSSDMETISINLTKDCWVDFKNGVRGVHLIMKGNVGPVTVMVIPNTPVTKEMSINDDHFYGIITPTSGGNIVVVGEKDEPIRQYSAMLASNISW